MKIFIHVLNTSFCLSRKFLEEKTKLTGVQVFCSFVAQERE